MRKMFTGIVEELGEVLRVERNGPAGRLTLRGPTVAVDATYGASIAVDGICLTVVEKDGDTFTVDVMPETFDRSSLGNLSAGDAVNLERPVKATDRLGGHIVQGHVDGVGTVVSRVPGPRWDVVRVGLPTHLTRYVAEKGSVAVDGVSLTVSAIGEDWFEVSLIPATLTGTTLGHRQPGSEVNVEVDVIAKYVGTYLERVGHATRDRSQA